MHSLFCTLYANSAWTDDIPAGTLSRGIQGFALEYGKWLKTSLANRYQFEICVDTGYSLTEKFAVFSGSYAVCHTYNCYERGVK